jgi:hypothetical protein
MPTKENGFLVLHRSPKFLTKIVLSPQAIRHLAKLERGSEILIRVEPEWNNQSGGYETKLSIKSERMFDIVREEAGYRRRRERV